MGNLLTDPLAAQLQSCDLPMAILLVHQYFYNLLVDPCTGLYKPVQALKATS
jgi:hypothetical protein